MSKFISAEPGPNKTVIYTDSEGKKYEYSKGDRAWRNNNPGNLKSGEVSKRMLLSMKITLKDISVFS